MLTHRSSSKKGKLADSAGVLASPHNHTDHFLLSSYDEVIKEEILVKKRRRLRRKSTIKPVIILNPYEKSLLSFYEMQR